MALQGRYLIGWYLVFLTLAACWIAGLPCGQALQRASSDSVVPRPGAASLRTAILLAVAGSVHVYCLAFILQRYF